jgi:hypothetical protein
MYAGVYYQSLNQFYSIYINMPMEHTQEHSSEGSVGHPRLHVSYGKLIL